MEQLDPLTGLRVRAELDSRLSEVLRSAASDEPTSVAFIDIDHFKRVNDTGGHALGDQVLAAVGRAVAAATRGKGVAFRYGGEEMVVVLPNHDRDEALAVGERVRRSVEVLITSGTKVTVSIGVATAPVDAPDAASVLQFADKARYDAKSRGRNLVRFHGEPTPTSPAPRVLERRQPKASWLSDEQRAEMRWRILRGLEVDCPADGAPLTIRDATTTASRGREYVVACPDCGRGDRLLSPH